MPIMRQGWEIHIVRHEEQRRASDGRRRTVGRYQVYHDGVAQTGPDMTGMVAESRGPGANAPAGNGRRIEEGRYPLWTQAGTKYVTLGYKQSDSPHVHPKPGIELKGTQPRSEILIHPGQGFVAAVGCINLCTSLPDAGETITYASSRRRVISVIEDLKRYCGGTFPTMNGRSIPGAFAVVDGEP